MAKAFVRATTIKEYVKGRVKNMRVSEETIDAIDKKVEAVLDEAIKRTIEDNRLTVKARDIA